MAAALFSPHPVMAAGGSACWAGGVAPGPPPPPIPEQVEAGGAQGRAPHPSGSGHSRGGAGEANGGRPEAAPPAPPFAPHQAAGVPAGATCPWRKVPGSLGTSSWMALHPGHPASSHHRRAQGHTTQSGDAPPCTCAGTSPRRGGGEQSNLTLLAWSRSSQTRRLPTTVAVGGWAPLGKSGIPDRLAENQHTSRQL